MDIFYKIYFIKISCKNNAIFIFKTQRNEINNFTVGCRLFKFHDLY